jgi:hypothetical protein
MPRLRIKVKAKSKPFDSFKPQPKVVAIGPDKKNFI